jgi:photosystem II stability/assembly factor-like uncharacterized protein
MAAANVFAFDPVDSSTFYVVAKGPAGIYQTTDKGETFAAVTWPFTTPSRVAISPANGQHILVADGSQVSVSRDGGGTWTPSQGLPATGTPAFAMSPKSEDTVLVAWLDGKVLTTYRSVDGGDSFTPAGTSGWSNGAFARIVYSGNALAPHAVITTADGAYLTVDDGDTWLRIDANATSHKFTSAHWMKGYLYLGTFGQGILRSTTRLN